MCMSTTHNFLSIANVCKNYQKLTASFRAFAYCLFRLSFFIKVHVYFYEPHSIYYYVVWNIIDFVIVFVTRTIKSGTKAIKSEIRVKECKVSLLESESGRTCKSCHHDICGKKIYKINNECKSILFENMKQICDGIYEKMQQSSSSGRSRVLSWICILIISAVSYKVVRSLHIWKKYF